MHMPDERKPRMEPPSPGLDSAETRCEPAMTNGPRHESCFTGRYYSCVAALACEGVEIVSGCATSESPTERHRLGYTKYSVSSSMELSIAYIIILV
jgi:hypothetical protein